MDVQQVFDIPARPMSTDPAGIQHRKPLSEIVPGSLLDFERQCREQPVDQGIEIADLELRRLAVTGREQFAQPVGVVIRIVAVHHPPGELSVQPLADPRRQLAMGDQFGARDAVQRLGLCAPVGPATDRGDQVLLDGIVEVSGDFDGIGGGGETGRFEVDDRGKGDHERSVFDGVRHGIMTAKP